MMVTLQRTMTIVKAVTLCMTKDYSMESPEKIYFNMYIFYCWITSLKCFVSGKATLTGWVKRC